MNETVKFRISSHAEILAKDLGSSPDIDRLAAGLADFVNKAYSLEYARQSDSFGVLYKECYSRLWAYFQVEMANRG